MSSDRDQVLGDVRLALQAGHRAPADSASAAVAPAWRQAGRLAREDVIALLTERAEEYGAVVRFTSSTGLAETLAAELAAAGVRRVVIPADIPSSWRVGGVEWLEDHGLGAGELDAVDGVVTGCAVAIAQTATIVLDGAERQGRRALTLVPDFHLCVVGVDQVVELVPEGVARLRDEARHMRPLTFVSGPSATSDIELRRVEGVHGPRRMTLVIVGSRETSSVDTDDCLQ
jgi:L-lactate dehydrogenase complex protein LldG